MKEYSSVKRQMIFEKNFLNFHQEKCQAKDEDFDLVHELVILENLIDKHLDKMDTCATSSNVVNEGINDEGYMDQLQSELNPKSWSDTDEGEDHDPYKTCSGQATSV